MNLKKHPLAVLLFLLPVLFACAGARDPLFLKYQAQVADLDQRASRGEISDQDAANLKLQAQQEYQEAKRREEKRLMDDYVERQLKEQNQDINAVINQAQRGVA